MTLNEIESRAMSLPDQARTFTIPDDAAYAVAAAFLLKVKSIITEIEQFCDPTIDAAHKTWQSALAQRRHLLEGPRQAEALVKPLLKSYHDEQERKRQQEARRLNEDARLTNALHAEQSGAPDTAERILNGELVTPPVATPPATPPIEGIAYRERWVFRIVDEQRLPREYLLADRVKIARIVTAMKAATRIPGVEVYDEGQILAKRS